jgi:hypothetical protein
MWMWTIDGKKIVEAMGMNSWNKFYTGRTKTNKFKCELHVEIKERPLTGWFIIIEEGSPRVSISSTDGVNQNLLINWKGRVNYLSLKTWISASMVQTKVEERRRTG